MPVPPFVRWACIGNAATNRQLRSTRQPLIGTRPQIRRCSPTTFTSVFRCLPCGFAYLRGSSPAGCLVLPTLDQTWRKFAVVVIGDRQPGGFSAPWVASVSSRASPPATGGTISG